MGIGGSALSGVSIMAKKAGFKVDGCDLEKNTSYLEKVKKEGIKVFTKHHKKHLIGVDILAATPAVVFQNRKHPEYLVAKEKNIFMTWDEFLGKYLLENKETICITGTHGKSTTTSLAALLFEKAELDPSVIIGAKIGEWTTNYRVGKGKYFIIEADDFYEKFLNYRPSTIILNNIEYDHPDFFSSENDMISSYLKFIRLLEGRKNLILNQDSLGNEKLFSILPKSLSKRINIFGYTFFENPRISIRNSVKIVLKSKDDRGCVFSLESNTLDLNNKYYLSIPGEYNVANATGVIVLAKIYGIKDSVISKVLKEFKGVERRLDLIGEKGGIKVYDDYAHHPTAIKLTLEALRQKYSKNKIWAVIEPHSYSRTKALLPLYKGAFKFADKVIIGPIYKARDTQKFGVDSFSIVTMSGHKDVRFVSTSAQIANLVRKEAKDGDVIVVMGAGYSYKWSRKILERL